MAHTRNKNQIENMITLQSMPSVAALILASKLIDYASNDMRIRMSPVLLNKAVDVVQEIESMLKEIHDVPSSRTK